MTMAEPKRVLVLLAAGAEEIETVTPVDVLRRAGADVVVAGVAGPLAVVGRSGIKLTPDVALDQVSGPFDIVVLPGGGQGAEILALSAQVQRLLREQEESGGCIGAICAAPIALISAGVGRGKAVTSHPSVERELSEHGQYRQDRVVRDGKLVTSRGPGTAMEFALTLVEELYGAEAAEEVAAPMLARR
jgi:protein DJ-1